MTPIGRTGGSNGGGRKRFHGFIEKLMMVFLGFAIAFGFTHLGLLREHQSAIDEANFKVSDHPRKIDRNKRRNEANTETGIEIGIKTAASLEQHSAVESAHLKTPEEPQTAARENGKPETAESSAIDGATLKVQKEPQTSVQEEQESNTETAQLPGNNDNEPCWKRKRLNVALFYADDWTMKVLGKLDKRVKTPNIDAMADNGMIFTNNCVTTSVCWASRSTLATGTYSAVHKHLMPFDHAEFEANVWPSTMYPLMKKGRIEEGPGSETCQVGYYSGLFGKWHKLEIEEELNTSFDEYRIYYGFHWEEHNGKMEHVTEMNKKHSIRFLDKWHLRFKDVEEKQPFFLTTSFFATHARDGEFPSYEPQNNTRLNVYPDFINIPTPKTATDEHWNQLPRFLRHEGNEGRVRWRKRFEPQDFQSNIKDMYAMATEVDEAVGAIIDKIKSLGAYDDTVLIFTTDNGNLHGEHGLAEKWYPFEESLRVPLVIQDPRMPKERRGTMSDAWTLNVDLAPTILGAANIPPSDFMQGRDISELYRNDAIEQATSLSNEEIKEKVGWRKDWFYEFNLGKANNGLEHPWRSYIDASFALVTDEWKYVVWPQHNYEQLFHRSVDPYDEWDLLNKVLRQKDTTHGDSKNGCCDTIQTTMEVYREMKERYAVLKERAQNGERI